MAQTVPKSPTNGVVLPTEARIVRPDSRRPWHRDGVAQRPRHKLAVGTGLTQRAGAVLAVVGICGHALADQGCERIPTRCLLQFADRRGEGGRRPEPAYEARATAFEQNVTDALGQDEVPGGDRHRHSLRIHIRCS